MEITHNPDGFIVVKGKRSKLPRRSQIDIEVLEGLQLPFEINRARALLPLVSGKANFQDKFGVAQGFLEQRQVCLRVINMSFQAIKELEQAYASTNDPMAIKAFMKLNSLRPYLDTIGLLVEYNNDDSSSKPACLRIGNVGKFLTFVKALQNLTQPDKDQLREIFESSIVLDYLKPFKKFLKKQRKAFNQDVSYQCNLINYLRQHPRLCKSEFIDRSQLPSGNPGYEQLAFNYRRLAIDLDRFDFWQKPNEAIFESLYAAVFAGSRIYFDDILIVLAVFKKNSPEQFTKLLNNSIQDCPGTPEFAEIRELLLNIQRDTEPPFSRLCQIKAISKKPDTPFFFPEDIEAMGLSLSNKKKLLYISDKTLFLKFVTSLQPDDLDEESSKNLEEIFARSLDRDHFRHYRKILNQLTRELWTHYDSLEAYLLNENKRFRIATDPPPTFLTKSFEGLAATGFDLYHALAYRYEGLGLQTPSWPKFQKNGIPDLDSFAIATGIFDPKKRIVHDHVLLLLALAKSEEKMILFHQVLDQILGSAQTRLIGSDESDHNEYLELLKRIQIANLDPRRN